VPALISRRALLRGGAAAAIGWRVVLDATLNAMAAVPACGGLADVEHVVFLIQENRSFDHYFGKYPGVRGFDDRSVRLQAGDDGTAVYRQANPGGVLNPVLPFHINTTPGAGLTGECTHDIGHQWIEQHQCWNNGKLDAYVKTHVLAEGPLAGPLTMGYYDRRDLPFYYALADAFTLCDEYHTSVISGTVANRIMGFSGTIDPDGKAGGPVVSTPESANQQDYLNLYGKLSWRTMPEVLQDAGISWKFYNPPDTALPLLNDNYLFFFKQFLANPALAANGLLSQTAPLDFALDCKLGRLPSVSWINAPFLLTEHPPTPIGWGEYAVSQVLGALTSNPELWAKTVLFLTWDDSGSFFDHVPPPVAPLGTAGEYLTAIPPSGGDGGIRGPIGLGPRVPMLAISPWSRNAGVRTDPGWQPLICSDTLDHTSMMRFLERLFAAKGVPGVALPNDTPWRKATVSDLTGAFSFASPVASIPALPATSLVTSLTYPECIVSPLTELPVPAPGAYPPPVVTANLPVQEPAPAGVRRPAGLAGCAVKPTDAPFSTVAAAAASRGTAPPDPVAGAGSLPHTGEDLGSLSSRGIALGALGAGLAWVIRRRLRSRPGEESEVPPVA
jgi:phospholipase C